jgi:hypothetical protein
MIPPSPSLSARMTNSTYFAVTTIISAQNTSDSRPSTTPVALPPPARHEALAQRVDWARANVAVHHTERAHDKGAAHRVSGC